MIRDFVGDWRLLALRGAVAVLFGMATLAWPGLTLWALVVMFGAFVLIDGVTGLWAVMSGRVEHDRAWWTLYALAGVAAGIVTFAWPSITGLALLFVIAAWAFMAGLVKLVAAVRMRKEIEHEWLLGAIGVLSMAVGVFLVVTPGAGALVITWAIGWFAIAFGVMLFALAWEVYQEARASRPTRMSARPGTPHPAT